MLSEDATPHGFVCLTIQTLGSLNSCTHAQAANASETLLKDISFPCRGLKKSIGES